MTRAGFKRVGVLSTLVVSLVAHDHRWALVPPLHSEWPQRVAPCLLDQKGGWGLVPGGECMGVYLYCYCNVALLSPTPYNILGGPGIANRLPR